MRHIQGTCGIQIIQIIDSLLMIFCLCVMLEGHFVCMFIYLCLFVFVCVCEDLVF